MGQPHKWRNEIVAWANGETIQRKWPDGWQDVVCEPSWSTEEGVEYRVKPYFPEVQGYSALLVNLGLGL